MPLVNSRSSLKDYCLRKLGAPVMQINVDDEQVEDRIDDALNMFFQYHTDGMVKQYMSIQLTEEMVEAKMIPMPDSVYSVTKVFPLMSATSDRNLSYVASITEMLERARISKGFGGMSNYYIFDMNLTMLQLFFNREKFVRFNRFQNQLQIDMDWGVLAIGDYILVESFTAIDMDTFDRSWDDWWLKSYATALIKKQWGQNMIKYDGFQLPSGITLNGRQIYDDAVQEIADLEEKLQNTYQLPVDFFIG